MSERDNKSEAMVEFAKRQGLKHARYDGTVVKVIRIMDKVDVQIELSAAVGERGAVKVGVYVDQQNYDTSLLHKRFGDTWAPEGVVREDSENWGTGSAGVQMWYRLPDVNWEKQFAESEVRQVFKLCLEVLDKALSA